MSKFIKNAFLVTCILSLQILKPAIPLYANTMSLTYDGQQHTYNKPPISLEINNKEISTGVPPAGMPPVQIEGHTLVPTREVFSAMGASVEWKDAEKKVYINHGDKLIVLEVNNPDAWVEGVQQKLDAPPKIINSKLMLPLRFIGEALGYKVDWEHETRHISINQIMTVPDVETPTITVPELKTKVEDVRLRNTNDGISSYSIYLESPLDSYTHFTQEGKVVVDIDKAKNMLDSKIQLADNPYVHTVRTSQYTPETTRVVFDLTTEVSSKVELSSNKKVITITMEGIKSEVIKPEIEDEIIEQVVERENFKYTHSPRETIVFKKVDGLLVSDIKIKDDYRNRKITVTLPDNYNHVYGDGLINIGSSTLDKILIQSNNKTEFIIYEKKIRAYDIIDDGVNITITFMEPREKYKQIILLDLGHGGSDSGATGHGLVEKNVVFEQGMALYNLLERDPNIKVYITREDDTYPANPARAQLANEVKADIFVSLHNNSFTNPGPNGTEVLYSTKSSKSKQMAQIIQDNMVRNLGTYDRKIKPRPGLIVLNQTNMPAVLVETAFLSNPDDAQKLRSSEFNRRVGQVLYDSIVEIFKTMSFR